MKNIICALLTVSLCFSFGVCRALETSAQSAIVIDAEHGNVIWQKNADKAMTMASTTKIMTALCAIEEGDLDKQVKINPAAVGVEGSSIYLKGGESFTLRELVYGLMLNSGNDAAVAIAYAVSGSVDKFCALMNKKAKDAGAVNTQFKNPNGLDKDGHFTTARDLARITAYALKNDEFKKIASTYQTVIGKGEDIRYLTNHNKLLKRMEGCIGVKTGFTKKSGRCLVSAAERDGVRLVAVTLSAPDDWNDHTAMMDYAYQRVRRKTITQEGALLAQIPTEKGTEKTASVASGSTYSVPAVDGVKYVSITKLPQKLTAPVNKGAEVGTTEVYMDGKLIKTIPVKSMSDVAEDKSKSIRLTVESVLAQYLKREPRNDK